MTTTPNARRDDARASSAVSAGRYVVLSVADTGTGMTQRRAPASSSPSSRPRSRARDGPRLSTVYGIVKQSGGYIDVESEPGRGTTFSLLPPPPAGDTARRARLARGQAASPGGGSETILLVEDEDGVRDMIAETLREVGYHVLEASTAERALAIASQHAAPIDLLSRTW